MIGLLFTMLLFFMVLALFGTVNKMKKGKMVSCEDEAFIVATDETVYIAHASKKYHKKGCHFISEDESPISKNKALEEGYSPCKICRP